jgi:hypothetical protein
MDIFVVLFGGAGILAYLTFGSDIQTVVLVNLDSHSKMVQSVNISRANILVSSCLTWHFRSNSCMHLPSYYLFHSNSFQPSESWKTEFSPEVARLTRVSNGQKTCSDGLWCFSQPQSVLGVQLIWTSLLRSSDASLGV